MTGGHPGAAGIITVSPGRQMTKGDVRRWLELMDADGADDTAPVFSLNRREPSGRRPEPYPGGLLPATAIGGYSRISTGPVRGAPDPREVPIDPP